MLQQAFFSFKEAEIARHTYNPQVWIDDDNIGHYKTTQSLRAKQSCETCKFTKKKPNICRKCKISDKRNNQSNYQRDTSIVIKFRELW